LHVHRPVTLFAIAVIASTFSVVVTPRLATAGSTPPLIAFADDYNGVFLTPAGGGGGETFVAGSTGAPAFSPNGLELAYIAVNDSADTATIEVANRTGGSPRKLLTGGSRADGQMKDISGPLVWSPNGKEIAYGCGGTLADGLKVTQLCTVDVSDGATHRITDADNEHYLRDNAHSDRLSWSSDGKEIVADVNKPSTCSEPGIPDCGNNYVGDINVKTGAVAVISENISYAPDLAPDDKHIVYYNPGSEENETRGIYVMGSSGGTGKLVVPQSDLIGGAQAVEPDPFYSPDGKDIVFGAYGMGTNPDYIQLFRVNADGSGKPLQLTFHNNNTYDGVWTPPLTTCTVPKLKGLTIAAAKRSLTKNACTLGKVKGPKKHRNKRHVTTQTIKAKTNKPAGTKVGITVR
jgi:Tol biopolymer transport system component